VRPEDPAVLVRSARRGVAAEAPVRAALGGAGDADSCAASRPLL